MGDYCSYVLGRGWLTARECTGDRLSALGTACAFFGGWPGVSGLVCVYIVKVLGGVGGRVPPSGCLGDCLLTFSKEFMCLCV